LGREMTEEEIDRLRTVGDIDQLLQRA
jgi:hypothetical protein